MIHNKQYKILNQFMGDYTREIYGRELIGRINISQKGIALALEELEQEGMLKSKKRGNMKFYSLNLKYSQIKEVIAMTELNRKMDFCLKNPKIGHIFRDDDRMVGIFGSHARGNQKIGSDIDVYIVGKRKGEAYDKKGKIYDLNISVKHFTEKEFERLLKQKNNLIKEIIKNHILIFNIEKFIDIVWKDYYGFD